MSRDSEIIVKILEGICGLLSDPNADIVWSRFDSPDEAISEFQKHIELIKKDDFSKIDDLSLLFAPTGSLQEISISSGWGWLFIDLSVEFDESYERIKQERGKLKTQVEFRSNKFPPYQNEEDQINPGLWGKRLAEFLRDKLPPYGFKVVDIGAEDWGWMVELENKAFHLWIGCGHQSGEDDEFLCFIEPSKPAIRRWFKKIDTTVQVKRVVEALSQILSSDPDIRDVHWRPNEEK